MDNENRNAIRATPGTHECEGETTLVYAVEGRPEVLRELVDALDLKVADHDLPRGARAGACRVWAASASATHADVAEMLRDASDRAVVDLVFAKLPGAIVVTEVALLERLLARALEGRVRKAAEGVEGAWKDLRAAETPENAAEFSRCVEVWEEARRQAEERNPGSGSDR